MSNFGDLFEDDERFREVEEDWSVDDLLKETGLFRFSKVSEKLGIDTKMFRQFLHRLNDTEMVRSRYGIIQDGWWRVRMKDFSKVAHEVHNQFSMEKLRARRERRGFDQYQKLPKGLSRKDFFALRGIFRLKQVTATGYLPYTYSDLSLRLRKDGEMLDRSITGCWIGYRYMLVDMAPFFIWILAQYRGITLEEATSLSGQE